MKLGFAPNNKDIAMVSLNSYTTNTSSTLSLIWHYLSSLGHETSTIFSHSQYEFSNSAAYGFGFSSQIEGDTT